MSRLVSTKTKKIALGEKEWIEVREQLPFEKIQSIVGLYDKTNEAANVKMALPLLELGAVNWCILDDDGNEIPFDVARIKDLDTQTVLDVIGPIIAMYFPQKKS